MAAKPKPNDLIIFAQAIYRVKDHIKTCRECFAPLLNLYGNPMQYPGEACVKGRRLLREYENALEVLGSWDGEIPPQPDLLTMLEQLLCATEAARGMLNANDNAAWSRISALTADIREGGENQ